MPERFERQPVDIEHCRTVPPSRTAQRVRRPTEITGQVVLQHVQPFSHFKSGGLEHMGVVGFERRGHRGAVSALGQSGEAPLD